MATKKYCIPEEESMMASEPVVAYGNAAAVPVPCQITVNIADMSMLKDIKRAISMIRGVISIDKSRAMKSYERARADVKAGRVVEFDDLESLKNYYDKL